MKRNSKLFACLVIAAMLCSMITLSSSGIFAATIISDNFDSDTVGNPPSSYTFGNGTNCTVTVSNADSVSTANSIKFVDSNTSGSAKAIRTFTANANPRLSVDVKTPSEWFEVSTLDSSSKYASRIYFKSDNKLYYYNGSSYVLICTYDNTIWNTLRVEYNGTAKTFNVLLNGNTVASNISYITTTITSLSKVQLLTGSGTTATGVYVDNVAVYDSASPTPTPTPTPTPGTPTPTPTPSGTPTPTPNYNNVVLGDNPVGYWQLASGVTSDSSGNGLNGSYTGSPTGTTMPNGDNAIVFNGIDQYFTVADNAYLEVTRTGIMTMEAWMRPDVLEFPNYEGSGYVHWMGKGVTNQHSWVARIYNYTNSENRPNRISGYSFNLTGGLGAGSYFQDTVTAGNWIHYALVINTVDTSPTYPTGYTKVFKSGVLRDQDSLSGYDIIPGDGTAPFRVGTRDMGSYFKGAIGKVAIYDYELTPAQLVEHYQAMGSPQP